MPFRKEQQKAYLKAATLCSQSEKCRTDILEKLKQWGLSTEAAVPVIDRLISEKYLDDERFARAYVKDKFRFNRWGKQKITFMLRAKEISAEIVEMALAEIEDSDYSEDLRKLIEEKAKTIKAKDKYDKRNKLMRFALGRGFESSQIYAALKESDI
jgi:regulatory protein